MARKKGVAALQLGAMNGHDISGHPIIVSYHDDGLQSRTVALQQSIDQFATRRLRV